jgi:hypothetical protein
MKLQTHLGLIVAVAGLLMGVSPAYAVYGHTEDPYYGRTTGYRPDSLILGDSTTFHAEDTYRRAPFLYKGELNGQSMRGANEFGGLVQERLTNPAPLRTVVFALGTNGGSWLMKRSWLAHRINFLKARGVRKVVLVTPYRDPALWTHTAWQGNESWRVAQLAKWERDIAAKRKGVCVAEWAGYAAQHRDQLVDGVHYDNDGEVAHVRLVTGALASRCR